MNRNTTNSETSGKKKSWKKNSLNYLLYQHVSHTFVNSLLKLIYRNLISHYVPIIVIPVSFYMWLVNSAGTWGDFSGPREDQKKT